MHHLLQLVTLNLWGGGVSISSVPAPGGARGKEQSIWHFPTHEVWSENSLSSPAPSLQRGWDPQQARNSPSTVQLINYGYQAASCRFFNRTWKSVFGCKIFWCLKMGRWLKNKFVFEVHPCWSMYLIPFCEPITHSIVWTQPIWFIHSSDDGHLGCSIYGLLWIVLVGTFMHKLLVWTPTFNYMKHPEQINP